MSFFFFRSLAMLFFSITLNPYTILIKTVENVDTPEDHRRPILSLLTLLRQFSDSISAKLETPTSSTRLSKGRLTAWPITSKVREMTSSMNNISSTQLIMSADPSSIEDSRVFPSTRACSSQDARGRRQSSGPCAHRRSAHAIRN